MKVLVVEDDVKTADALRRGLEAEGYTVEVAHDGDDGFWLATEADPDVIVLDVLLPRRNGFELCRDLRATGTTTPILMLTAKDGEWDEAEGLDLGADDYLIKPFSFTVLCARLRTQLRRGVDRPTPQAVGDLRIDPAERRVWRGDVEVTVTRRQFDVLEFLVRRAGQVMSKSDILRAVWPIDFDGDSNIVEVYVRRLRSAIDEPFGRASIETLRGAGYRIVDDGAVTASTTR